MEYNYTAKYFKQIHKRGKEEYKIEGAKTKTMAD